MSKYKHPTRAETCGYLAASAIIEMVHLMYQKTTARNFFSGFYPPIKKEIERRGVPFDEGNSQHE